VTPRNQSGRGNALERLSSAVTRWTGGTAAFAIALGVVVAWAVSGPAFGYSNTWQLVINTGTTIVTFLMVFLIQRAQNKDAMAIQLKLNELVAAVAQASNALIDIEDLSEEDLETLHQHYAMLAGMAQSASAISASHSLDHARARHDLKHAPPRRRVRARRPGGGA
jgi:low affinity Fe/Cu permease